MLEEKKRKLERKKAKKIKEMQKQGALNPDAFRREIFAYQRRLAIQSPWDHSFPAVEHNYVDVKNKDQHNEPQQEVKG
jgi:hypothetical protein